MPARAVDDLGDLMPEDSMEKISSLGYDIEEIKRAVQRSGYLPQELLDVNLGKRTYKVWLD